MNKLVKLHVEKELQNKLDSKLKDIETKNSRAIAREVKRLKTPKIVRFLKKWEAATRDFTLAFEEIDFLNKMVEGKDKADYPAYIKYHISSPYSGRGFYDDAMKKIEISIYNAAKKNVLDKNKEYQEICDLKRMIPMIIEQINSKKSMTDFIEKFAEAGIIIAPMKLPNLDVLKG